MKRSAIFLLFLSILLVFTGCDIHLTHPEFTKAEIDQLFSSNKSVMELVAQDIIKKSDSLMNMDPANVMAHMQVQILGPNAQQYFSDVEWRRLDGCYDKGWCLILMQEKSKLKMAGFAVSAKDKTVYTYYYINDGSLKQYVLTPHTDIDDHWFVIHTYEGNAAG